MKTKLVVAGKSKTEIVPGDRSDTGQEGNLGLFKACGQTQTSGGQQARSGGRIG
jgi:hypothetical protein